MQQRRQVTTKYWLKSKDYSVKTLIKCKAPRKIDKEKKKAWITSISHFQKGHCYRFYKHYSYNSMPSNKLKDLRELRKFLEN